MSGGFNFPWVSTPFPGGTPLGGKFSNWGSFPFINTSGSWGFFPGPNFGNIFPGGSTSIPGGNPLRGTSSPGRSHAPGSATIPGGTHSSGTPQQPSGSMNVGGPQGSSGTTKTSSPSQYSFSHTSFPFLTMLDLPDLSWLKNDPISHNPSWSTMPGKYLQTYQNSMEIQEKTPPHTS
jgi:hypothetical protein